MIELCSVMHKDNLVSSSCCYYYYLQYFLLLYVNDSGLYQLSLQANQYIT